MRDIVKLEEGCYYHIYNRGINGRDIFKAPRDYGLFIKSFEEYSKDVLDHDLIGEEPTFLKREIVMSWFGGKENFIKSHLEYPYKVAEEKWAIEY